MAPPNFLLIGPLEFFVPFLDLCSTVESRNTWHSFASPPSRACNNYLTAWNSPYCQVSFGQSSKLAIVDIAIRVLFFPSSMCMCVCVEVNDEPIFGRQMCPHGFEGSKYRFSSSSTESSTTKSCRSMLFFSLFHPVVAASQMLRRASYHPLLRRRCSPFPSPSILMWQVFEKTHASAANVTANVSVNILLNTLYSGFFIWGRREERTHSSVLRWWPRGFHLLTDKWQGLHVCFAQFRFLLFLLFFIWLLLLLLLSTSKGLI